ncbi:hypothetical protein AOLI_G00071570 [Acnodon oligacanthus]
MRSLMLLLLIHLAATDSTPSRVAKCIRTQDLMPMEWYKVLEFTPSALRDLDLKLNLQNGPTASPSLTISWSINIDSSIHNITGTWIELNIRSHSNPDPVRYRCDYQPPFSSKPTDYSGLEQLWFSFTSTDVNIEPTGFYKVDVYNLPSPPTDMGGKHSKTKEVQAPGCDNAQMRTHSTCSILQDMDIYAVPDGDEIVVSFEPRSYYESYDILLQRNTANLHRIKVQRVGKIRIKERLKYSGPCENLRISIKPIFKNCGTLCKWIRRDIDCTKKEKTTQQPEPETEPESQPESKIQTQDNTALLISVGCAVAVAVGLILICCCQLCRLCIESDFSKCGLTSVSSGSVGVLMVYPAVDSVFQHAVMALADFLQSQKGLNVVIDMWQRGCLAEQGPLRWLNSQADQAYKVLIILPPQHKNTVISADTDCPKQAVVPGIADYTVPASAHELFSLALNLVASSAHDPQQHHKFWVVCLGPGEGHSTVPVELRGCKILSLPKDLEKLPQKLASRPGERCSSLRCRMWSFQWRETSRKVRQALLQLDRSRPSCSKEETVRLTEVECKP